MKKDNDFKGYEKTENIFKLLRLILEHGIIQRREICKVLGVTDRQVLKYVKNLRGAGINVKSKTGVYGGYYIEDWDCPICNSKLYTKSKNKFK